MGSDFCVIGEFSKGFNQNPYVNNSWEEVCEQEEYDEINALKQLFNDSQDLRYFEVFFL